MKHGKGLKMRHRRKPQVYELLLGDVLVGYITLTRDRRRKPVTAAHTWGQLRVRPKKSEK